MSSFTAATRPTRRDVVKHPWRSLAAIILIMIPVVLAAIGVIHGGSQSSSYFLNNPRTSATYLGGVCEQNVNGYLSECEGGPDTQSSEYELLRQNIPEGFTVALSLSGTIEATFGDQSANLYFTQTTAEMAPEPGEAFVPQRFLDTLGAEVGDTITLANGAQVTVSAVTPSGTTVFPEPTVTSLEDYSGLADNDLYGNYGGSWAITGPEAFTWDDVLALNAVGFTVTSRDVIDNPPPADQVAFEEQSAPYSPSLWDYLGWALWFVPMAIMAFLILMLISPVFTISVSRQTRNFALLASQGATPRHIRWAVLMYGLFAGLVGATLGLFLGTVGAAAWWSATYPAWPVVIDWHWLLLVWGLAVVGSTAAAFLPAFIAGRSSIIRGVQGGEADRIMRWRKWMTIGPVSLVILGLMFLYLQLTDDAGSPQIYSDSVYVPWREALRSFGTLFAVIAVVASAPMMVWLLGHLKGALAVRLAARDLLRQSMRSIPAVAALAGVIFIATALLVSAGAESEKSTAATDSVYPQGTMFLSLDNGIESDLDAAVAQVDAQLDGVQRIDVYGHRDLDTWLEADGFTFGYSGDRDWVYPISDSLGGTISIASPELMDFFNVDDADLGGRAVLISSLDEQVQDIRLQVNRYDNRSYDTEVIASTLVDTRPVLPPLAGDRLVTEEAFADLGLERSYLGAVLVHGEPINSSDTQEIQDFFRDTAGVGLSFPTWNSDQNRDSLLWAAAITGLMIAVMALVLALSSQQIRRQRIVLEAVGAAPTLSRWSNALFGALCALGAALLGLITGHVGAALTGSLSQVNEDGVTTFYGSLQFIEPLWPMILGTLVIAPLITAAIGWAFTPTVELSEYRD